MLKKYRNYILLSLIILFGLFLRVYNIDNAPPGIYPDEAVNGLDALSASEGNWEWFYTANNGREGLFMNLIAICFKLFGVSVFALKLPSIIFGTLAILGTYLLAKEVFRNERIGLISAFLTATSFWAINFSRIGFRAIMLPAILAFSFYFLWRGIRTKKWYDFAIGGFIFGLGLHTYIAFRIAPAILIVMLAIFIWNRKSFLKDYWKSVLIFIVFTILSASPMLYTFFISHPEYLESRSASVSIFSPEANGGHPVYAFLKSFSLSILKYNFWGDQNWRHNFPPYPLLDPITGMAFVFGLIYATVKFFHLLALKFFKKTRDRKLEIYTFLLSSFFFMLVPEFMTAEGNPHALRAIGSLPFTFIISALIFNYFFEYAENHRPILKKTILIIFISMLFSIGIFDSVKYHLVWAKKIKTAESFEKTNMSIVKFINFLSPQTEIFVIMDNMQRVPIRLFQHNRENFHDLHPMEAKKIKPKDPKNFIVIFSDYQKDEIIKDVTTRFPLLQPEEVRDEFDLKFYILK